MLIFHQYECYFITNHLYQSEVNVSKELHYFDVSYLKLFSSRMLTQEQNIRERIFQFSTTGITGQFTGITGQFTGITGQFTGITGKSIYWDNVSIYLDNG